MPRLIFVHRGVSGNVAISLGIYDLGFLLDFRLLLVMGCGIVILVREPCVVARFVREQSILRQFVRINPFFKNNFIIFTIFFGRWLNGYIC